MSGQMLARNPILHRPKALVALAASVALLALAGCDLLGRDDTLIVATGRVVLAETGEPVAGLGVSLDGSGRILRFVLATARTGPDGRFRIEYDPGADDRNPHSLLVNDEPYDARYTTSGATYIRGEVRDLGDIEIRRVASP